MPSKPDIWMPLYIGDYLAATAHLDAEESGAYLHLLMHSWKNGSLPADTESLRRIAKVSKDAWSNAWRVLMPFFDFSEDGTPSQGRLERIREDWSSKQLKSKDKARKAAESRWSKADASSINSDAPSTPQAMLEPCPSPIPSPISKEQQQRQKTSTKVVIELPPWVDIELWGAYLEVRKKKRAVMTERALKAILDRLAHFGDKGYEPMDLLATSVRSNWIDIYEPKNNGGTNGTSKAQQREDRNADAFRGAVRPSQLAAIRAARQSEGAGARALSADVGGDSGEGSDTYGRDGLFGGSGRVFER